MTKFFKIFDFYGTHFHWYFNNRPKYYTNYGGILSLLSLMSWVTVLVILGNKDFKRMYPSSSTISNIPPNGDKKIKSGETKLYLPWRIMDYNEKFIDHHGILFPRIYYFTNRYNNETGLMETFYLLLNYTLCNETSMKYLGKDFLLNEKLDTLFCIDMEDINIGGSWNSDFVNYIRLDLNLCKNGMNYDESNSNCTSREDFNALFGINNNWYFELLYPSVQFQPNNKELPIFVLYNSYYFGLSTSSNKVDRIYFQEHIFEDETGWVFDTTEVNSSYWGVSSIKSDYYAQSERDIFRYGSTSRLYSFKLYLDYGTVFYTRKYKKIYEIFSDIFPIMKAILAICTFVTEMINELKASKKLNEFIINNNDNLFKSKKDNELISKSNKVLRNIKFKYSVQHNNTIYNEFPPFNSIIKNEKDSSKIICLPIDNSNNNKTNFNSNKENNLKNLNKKKRNTINFNRSNTKLFETFNAKGRYFPLNYYFYGYFLNKLNPKKSINYMCVSKKFDTSFSFYTHLIDITSYISLFQQFQLLKNLVIEKIKKNKAERDKMLLNKNYSKIYSQDIVGSPNFNFNVN